MPLGMTAEMISAFQDEHTRVFFALRAEFASSTLRINTTPYTLTFDGQTFGPNTGGLGRISSVETDSTLQVRTVTLELNGVPNDKVALAAMDRYKGRPAHLYFGLLDASFQVIPSPFVCFGGQMDMMSSETDEFSTVQLVIGNRLLGWERPNIRRYNSADQQQEYPGDKGMDFVPSLVEKNIQWGVA